MRATPNAIAPLRLLRAWLFRERAVRGPAAIELDVVEHQLDREQAAVAHCAAEAGQIERKVDGAKRALGEALADGVIDAAEARRLARQLVGTSVAASHHHRRLEGLL